jgi:hypothetical protein
MAQKTKKKPAASANGISDDLRRKAESKNWPLIIIEKALEGGVKEESLHQAMDAGMTPLQARQMLTEDRKIELSLAWTKVDTPRGTRSKIGKKGLTIDAINAGPYGEVPDIWPDQTMRPRGAYTKPGAVSMGYTIYSKAEVWSNNLGELYEEAIQRRWAPATDIPWESISPLPEDRERAIGQICTALCEYNYAIILSLGKWVREVSYGFHEVKLFLSTVLFDAGRHYEAFRKRALANGSGLGVQAPGDRLMPIREAMCFAEMATVVFMVNDSFVLSLYQALAALAQNDAETELFALAAQDKARHVAYGIDHTRYLIEHQPERHDEIRRYLNKGEEYLSKDRATDTPLREALAIHLGGGLSNIGEGFRKLDALHQRQLQAYLGRVEAAGLKDHENVLWPELAKDLPPAQA